MAHAYAGIVSGPVPRQLASLLRRRRRIDRRISQLLGQEPATDDLPWQLSDEQLEILRSLTWTPRPEAQLQPAEITVVGVDGARGGWAAVELLDRAVVAVRVFPALRALVDEYGQRAKVIALTCRSG
jgi:hypothetical protein